MAEQQAKEEAKKKAMQLNEADQTALLEKLHKAQGAKDPIGAVKTMLKDENGLLKTAVTAVKKAIKDSTLTKEAKDKVSNAALLAQKRLLALKTELKKETDKKQFALAAAKEKAQKDVDKKFEVKLDSKSKLAIAKKVMQLADVSKKLTGDVKADAKIR